MGGRSGGVDWGEGMAVLHASVGIGMRGDRGVIFYGGRPYLCGMWWWGESWRISIRDLLARLWYVMVGERGVGLQAMVWAGGEVKNAERAKSWLASGLVVKRQEVWTFRKRLSIIFPSCRCSKLETQSMDLYFSSQLEANFFSFSHWPTIDCQK